MTGAFITREEDRHTETHRKESHGKVGAESPKAKKFSEPLGAWRSKEGLSPRSFGENVAADTLILYFQLPELSENKLLLL